MKLIKAHATNYRNIMDSNVVDIGQSTCLVGKNEAGKSAFLKTLEGIKSTDTNFKDYNKITNYPRQNLSEYDNIHEGNEALVMSTTWQLDRIDIRLVEAELGQGILSGDTFTVRKTYEQTNTNWDISTNELKVLAHLSTKHDLSSEDKAVFSEAKTTKKRMMHCKHSARELLLKKRCLKH